MRKLVWVACGFTAALLLAHYLLPLRLLLPLAGASAVLAVPFLFVKRRRCLAVSAALAAAAVGFAWLWAYTALFVTPAEQFVGEKRTVTVRIADYADVYDDYSRVEAYSLDGEVPHVRMLLYDYECGFGELRPGDIVSMELKLTSAAKQYGQDSDYYLAGGVHLRAYLAGDYVVQGRWKLAFLCFPQEIARAVKEQTLRAFPDDVAPLMKALLTGDKREYYEDDALYSAMKTAGFVHVVAVSGMHVAFIISVLSLLIGRRRRTAFIGLPLILVFMAMVGFTPSVVRAGVMQMLLLIAPLLRRENDAPTSFAAALLLLLLINPNAVGSLSLQLSFAAMAGLILISPKIYDWLAFDSRGKMRWKRGPAGRLMNAVCGVLSSSVGALLFTTPISALAFGCVPVYSILTNLLCLWAMSAAFVLGYAACIVGLLWQGGGAAMSRLVAWLPRYTIFVVKRIAHLPNAVIYTEHNLGGWWLLFVYLVFTVSYLLRGTGRFRPILPLCACIFTFTLLNLLLPKRLDGAAQVTVLDVGQGQSIAALSENGTVVIDCGSTSSPENAGDIAANYLLSGGRGSVDLLVLTHFHADHANGAVRLMNRMEVQRLAIPMDCEDSVWREEILALCEQNGTEVYYIEKDARVTVDTLELTLYAPLGSESENERGLLVRGDYGDFEFLVTGDAGSAVERLLISEHDLGDMELLVVGHHGSRYSTCGELLDDITPEAAVISVGAGNSYGHPTEDVLERLERRGIDVYRTDEGGTITIMVGEDHGET